MQKKRIRIRIHTGRPKNTRIRIRIPNTVTNEKSQKGNLPCPPMQQNDALTFFSLWSSIWKKLCSLCHLHDVAMHRTGWTPSNKNHLPVLKKQCCGSGSEFGSGSTGSKCFWASWIRIRILLSLSKFSKKNLDLYSFVTSFWLFIYEKLCKSTFKK